MIHFRINIEYFSEFPDNKNFIFQGFGKADHQVSVGLLKKKYPDYVITWSDEGY